MHTHKNLYITCQNSHETGGESKINYKSYFSLLNVKNKYLNLFIMFGYKKPFNIIVKIVRCTHKTS